MKGQTNQNVTLPWLPMWIGNHKQQAMVTFAVLASEQSIKCAKSQWQNPSNPEVLISFLWWEQWCCNLNSLERGYSTAGKHRQDDWFEFSLPHVFKKGTEIQDSPFSDSGASCLHLFVDHWVADTPKKPSSFSSVTDDHSLTLSEFLQALPGIRWLPAKTPSKTKQFQTSLPFFSWWPNKCLFPVESQKATMMSWASNRAFPGWQMDVAVPPSDAQDLAGTPSMNLRESVSEQNSPLCEGIRSPWPGFSLFKKIGIPAWTHRESAENIFASQCFEKKCSWIVHCTVISKKHGIRLWKEKKHCFSHPFGVTLSNKLSSPAWAAQCRRLRRVQKSHAWHLLQQSIWKTTSMKAAKFSFHLSQGL